jgi:hypothetical protein
MMGRLSEEQRKSHVWRREIEWGQHSCGGEEAEIV